jgi:hypothetical protein
VEVEHPVIAVSTMAVPQVLRWLMGLMIYSDKDGSTMNDDWHYSMQKAKAR